ncbi:MAG: leucyl/phenylalanyl-tRNA--protein transferase [Alphaproteobacteria bacterium]|nr:leucyl/phenylalanyl-tRNA--protein transferase [Alphaproteobacteria bacterium]
MQLVLTPELILEAYRHGLFPMAYSGDSEYVHWICPELRGQLPIAELHIPRRLNQTLRAAPFDIRIDIGFEAVMRACAEKRQKRPETWINEEIIESFCALHERGHAHSVECWDGSKLVGGVYGLKIGAAFFGESMFSRARDASKIALVHLTARLWRGGFRIFDTQFINDHLKQFGVYEIPHERYMQHLNDALGHNADFALNDLSTANILEEYLNMKRETGV